MLRVDGEGRVCEVGGELFRGFVYVQTQKERPAHVITHLPATREKLQTNGQNAIATRSE
jgi:hypothetical protein